MECCFIISSITESRTIGAKNGMSRLTGRACLSKRSGACLGMKILSDPFVSVDALKELQLNLENF